MSVTARTLTVLVDVGSRYEVNYTSGISHFLQRLAFQGTSKFPSRESIMDTLDPVGGVFGCQRFRDVMVYTVSTFSYSLPQAMEVLAEGLWRPALKQEEVLCVCECE